MEQRDIVWIKLLYSNLEEEKIRPALVVSNTEYNLRNLDVVVCGITSNLDKRPYSILISQKDLSEGNLPVPSRIKADKIMQVEKTRILKPFAKLKEQTYKAVIDEITKLVK